MRTAIICGFIILADSVNPDFSKGYNKETVTFIGILVLIMIVMDVSDFFRNKKK